MPTLSRGWKSRIVDCRDFMEHGCSRRAAIFILVAREKEANIFVFWII